MGVEEHYDARLRIFAAEPAEPGATVFLGSSHIELFDTPRFLPGRRIVNRGIAGDRLGLTERGILHRLDISVFECEPAFIVFENGANDLGELWRAGAPPLAAIIDCYERVVAAIRGRLPDVPLLIVNVLPTTGRFAGLNPFVRQFNPHVLRIAQRYGGAHMDFYSDVVVPAGCLRHALATSRASCPVPGELCRELTEDGLHLNDRGYALWAERLAPYLPPT